MGLQDHSNLVKMSSEVCVLAVRTLRSLSTRAAAQALQLDVKVVKPGNAAGTKSKVMVLPDLLVSPFSVFALVWFVFGV